MKKNLIKYIVIAFSLMMLSGCGSDKYIYIKPEYPIITAPRSVPLIDGAFVRKGCLWIEKHNTMLCDNDLKLVLTQIDKLRENEKTCQRKADSYNEFVTKKIQKDVTEYKLPK